MSLLDESPPEVITPEIVELAKKSENTKRTWIPRPLEKVPEVPAPSSGSGGSQGFGSGSGSGFGGF